MEGQYLQEFNKKMQIKRRQSEEYESVKYLLAPLTIYGKFLVKDANWTLVRQVRTICY